ncbi:MAG TPA: hypothetical protein VIY66_14150 [Candidatus Acidoferrales bacterium]
MNEKFFSHPITYLAVLVLGALSLAPGTVAQTQGRRFPPGQAPGRQMPPGAQLPPQAQSTRVPPDELAAATAAGKKTPTGEQFFIVASVDLQKSQLLLKYPTEVTLLAHVDDKTKYLDSAGKPAKLSSLRAGDTVWVTLSNGGASGVKATKVRKGDMTVAELHHYYLDYPVIK